MVPTLRAGDLLIVRTGARIGVGDVVIARFRSMPEREVVKRTARRADGGWWLASDNEFARGDSSVHGTADTQGRVVLILRPGGRRRSWRALRARLRAPTI
ncbi:MAG: putative signal peptidase [Pseudonocardiales bacterium]|nr:putative signal peptidase [Pseudonocardiales bacterium]